MTRLTQGCDPTRIARLSSGTLNAADEQILEQHVSTCNACCQAMQDAVAGRDIWEKTGLYLRVGPDEHQAGDVAIGYSMIDRVLEILSPTDDPEMLGRIGSYEISGVIGTGGMGALLKGFDRSLNRVVAIKVMAPHLATSGAARMRFQREAQAAAAITHENVIDIYGVSEAGGLPYLVMPYAGGTSLQKRIDAEGPMPLVEVLRIGRQIASGLAAAHDQGLVHRDIKPSNILLSEGIGRLLITDFGLARAVDDASVTRTGVIAGTPQYMSPEQARGERIDHRSDLFSLGSVLYACCTGRPPFRAETTFGILRRISDNPPRSIRESNPDTPQWFCDIVDRLLAKSLTERLDSALEVADLFESCLAHVRQPLNNPLPTSCHRLRDTMVSKPRKAIVLTLGACLVLLAALSVLIRPSRSGQRSSLIPATEIATVSDDSVPDDSTKLRYSIPWGKKITYLMTMSVVLPDSDVQLDGLVCIESHPSNDGNLHLWFSPQLELSETTRTAKDEPEGRVYTGQTTQSSHFRTSRSESVTITDQGDVISAYTPTELPYDLGTLPELLFRRLPADSDALKLAQGKTQLTLAETSNIDGEMDSFVTEFAFGSGVPDSVRVVRTITIPLDDTDHRVPVQVELMRLTDAERDAWLVLRQAELGTPLAERKLPLSAEDEANLLSDLGGDRRVLYWLHRIRRCPADELTPDIVDAVIELSHHSNPTFKTVASRILDEIPEEMLNPFSVTQ